MSIINSRKIWLSLSATFVGISVIVILVLGLNIGIDFTGGSFLEYQFDSLPANSEVQQVITQLQTKLNADLEDQADQGDKVKTEKIDFGRPVIQPTSKNTILLRLKTLSHDSYLALSQTMQDTFNKDNKISELRYENIGPIVGKSLRKKAIISLILAIIFIILFVAFAFRKIPKSISAFRFGLTAVIALIHDVIVTLGIFVVLGYVFKVEIDSLFITAMLTVMGYSVNDTIVIFDRLRENIIHSRHQEFAEIANDSINQTIARSINTSLTTVITLSAMFFLGGVTIKWFVLAMLIGVIVGTYSSIFLAAPLLVSWHGLHHKSSH